MKKESSPTLTIKSLSVSLGGTEILSDINLELLPSRFVGLLGPNGAGKSTLLKSIAGLLTIKTGEITIKNTFKVPSKEARSHVSFLPERNFLDRSETVSQSISFFEDFFPDFDSKKAKSLIKDLDIDEKKKLSSLSKGMLEKLQLILAISRKADLYLLDEPLGGVDPATRDYILSILKSNIPKDSTVFISTHLISDIEPILDDICFISEGHIKTHENKANLTKKYNKTIDGIFRKEYSHVR